MKNPSTRRSACRPISSQSQLLPDYPVLLLAERLLPAGLFLHQRGDTAAIQADAVEQLVPERTGAEAGHHRQVEADLDQGTPERAAAHLRLEFLQGRHEQFGVVPAGGRDGRGAGLRATGCFGRLRGGGGLAGCRRGSADRSADRLARPAGWVAVARSGGWTKLDIPAPRRAREQHALQRGGAQDAALQVREDRIQPAGAEAGRDGVEVGGWRSGASRSRRGGGRSRA